MADIQALNTHALTHTHTKKNHNFIHFLSSASFTNFTYAISRGQKTEIKSPAAFFSRRRCSGVPVAAGLRGEGAPSPARCGAARGAAGTRASH